MLSDLPFVELPKTSPLNKGATVLEAVKIGPVLIPVTQFIFEHLDFFHSDTVQGSLELWGNEYVARIILARTRSPLSFPFLKRKDIEG